MVQSSGLNATRSMKLWRDVKSTEQDEDLEDLVMMEIIVDCYNEDEVASGLYHYLLDHLGFAFTAVWLEGTPQ